MTSTFVEDVVVFVLAFLWLSSQRRVLEARQIAGNMAVNRAPLAKKCGLGWNLLPSQPTLLTGNTLQFSLAPPRLEFDSSL